MIIRAFVLITFSYPLLHLVMKQSGFIFPFFATVTIRCDHLFKIVFRSITFFDHPCCWPFHLQLCGVTRML